MNKINLALDIITTFKAYPRKANTARSVATAAIEQFGFVDRVLIRMMPIPALDPKLRARQLAAQLAYLSGIEHDCQQVVSAILDVWEQSAGEETTDSELEEEITKIFSEARKQADNLMPIGRALVALAED